MQRYSLVAMAVALVSIVGGADVSAQKIDTNSPEYRLVRAVQVLSKARAWRADMTIKLLPIEADPFAITVRSGLWTEDGKAKLPVTAEILGQKTESVIYFDGNKAEIEVTSAIDGEKTLLEASPTLLKRIGVPNDEFHKIADELMDYLDKKKGNQYYVWEVVLTDGYKKYEGMDEDRAKKRLESLQDTFRKQMQKYIERLEAYKGSPEYQQYMRKLALWQRTRQGKKPREPTFVTINGRKRQRKPEPPTQPHVDKVRKAGEFDFIEEAEAAASNVTAAVETDPDPIGIESLMERYRLKRGVTVGKAAGEVDGAVGFRVEAKRDKGGPIDYYIDRDGVLRGIDRFDSEGRKLMEIRISNFYALDREPDRDAFRYEDDGQKIERQDLNDLVKQTP